MPFTQRLDIAGNNGKLTFTLALGDDKKQEIWTFLTSKLPKDHEIVWALSNPIKEHHVAVIEYWHKSTDPNDHITVGVMHDVYLEEFYHVYRDGTSKRIDEGRNLYYTTEDEKKPDGSVKKVRVWRFKDGGVKVNEPGITSVTRDLFA